MCFYLAVSLLRLSALSLFAAMPDRTVAAVVGLGLFGTISVTAASTRSPTSDTAAAASDPVVLASGFSLFQVAAPFWALVVGVGLTALRSP
ncbi:MAG: benzoate/H(+) symporter BenE family transporter [Ilumatobacteraceae bacterium]